MELDCIENIITEIRSREDFLLKIKESDVDLCVSYWGYSNNVRIFRPSDEEIAFLKQSCLKRIEELKNELGASLTE